MTEKKREQLIEGLKNVAIVLLALCALYLAGRTQLFGGLFAGLSGAAVPSVQGGTEQTYTEFIHPAHIAAMNDGGRHGVLYSASEADDLFERTASLLAEALGSAGAPHSVSREEWEHALSTAPGLYFDLLGTTPLETLQQWLSGGEQGRGYSGAVRRLCLTADDSGAVWLYYINETDGMYYACRADVLRPGQLQAVVSSYTPNGACFAFEREEYAALDPDTLLPGETPEMPLYGAANPLTADGGAAVEREVLEALGFAAQSNASYTMPDGVVYRSGADTLRLNHSGEVFFQSGSAAAPRFPVTAGGDGWSETDLARAGGDILHDVLLPYLGEGKLFLHSVTLDGDGGTVEFSYALSGSETVLNGGAPAARFTVKDGQITSFTLWMRTYTATGGVQPVLPLRQALAAAAAEGIDKRELRLTYRDSLTDAMSAGWSAA